MSWWGENFILSTMYLQRDTLRARDASMTPEQISGNDYTGWWRVDLVYMTLSPTKVLSKMLDKTTQSIKGISCWERCWWHGKVVLHQLKTRGEFLVEEFGNTSLGSPVTWWGTGMEEISNGWLSHLRCLGQGWTGKGLAEFIRAIESKIHNEKVTVWYLKNEHEQAYMRRYMTFMKTYPQYFLSILLYFTTNSDR